MISILQNERYTHMHTHSTGTYTSGINHDVNSGGH